MTRRPRRNLPPHLDVVPTFRAPASSSDVGPEGPGTPRVPTDRRALVDAHLTGPHGRLGREAVRQAIRAVVNGDRRARLDCDGLDGCTVEEVRAALVKSHGWDPDSPRAAIEPDRTLDGARTAAARLRAAADAGARVALATSRPAALLALSQHVAGHVARLGAEVLSSERASVEGRAGRELWWVGGVAVLTDGSALLSSDGVPVGDDWLFALGRPDLVVADRAFAGAALRAGVDVIAWADLDAPALALAAARGRPVVVVPVDEGRPAASYGALADVVCAHQGSQPPA